MLSDKWQIRKSTKYCKILRTSHRKARLTLATCGRPWYIRTGLRLRLRITGNASFALPRWQWQADDRSLFATEYYGIPSNNYSSPVNVSGQIINTDDWNTVCDLAYQSSHLNCSELWRLCNPENDLAARRPLQRGVMSTAYLPNRIEVKVAIAAPSYDAANTKGQYFRDSPRQNFRSRLEGWNIICSAVNCTGPQDIYAERSYA